MNKKNQNNQPSVSENESTTNWVFIPLAKELILKRTEKYILFKVGGASAIVNAVFKRKKESETHIFLSVPETYMFGVKHNEYDAEKGRWVTINQKDVSAKDMKEYLQPKKTDLPDDDLPF